MSAHSLNESSLIDKGACRLYILGVMRLRYELKRQGPHAWCVSLFHVEHGRYELGSFVSLRYALSYARLHALYMPEFVASFVLVA